MGGIAALLAFSISSFASAHWSFQPVDKPSIPLVNDGSQVLNPLDFFILKKLEEAKIQPTKEASREVLIRRIYFSLTGLPPTFDQVQEFAKDTQPDAYELSLIHI